MGILTRKITTYVKNIVDLSDHPNDDGLDGDQLKAMFDGRTNEEIKVSINGIVDDLLAITDGASGADQIGATPITGGTAAKIQGILEELNTLKAADSAVVHKTGTETVEGVKTFSSSPIVPAPTTDLQAVTKKYVDDADAAKVNTSAIVNDLTTGGTTVPLSAEQGKTLKTQIGAQTYTEDNYVTDAASDTANIDALDMAVKDNADLISTNTLKINEKTSYGVYTGLVVAQQTVADMTVKCSAGTIYMANGDRFAIDAVASIAVTAADATNPRIDIVYVSSVGAITYLAGTAAASPAAPATPAGGQKIREINVAAGATSIVAANITDKRKFLWVEAWITPTLLNNWVNFGAGESTCQYHKDAMGYVHLKGIVKSGTIINAIFTLPVGYRPSELLEIGTISSAAFGWVNITNSGLVRPMAGSAEWFSLDGIVFKAEA